MKYGYIFLASLLLACSSESVEEETSEGAVLTEEQLRSNAQEIADKALDLTGAGISEIPPMKVGKVEELPEDLEGSYVADYLVEQGFTIDEVDEDIVPPYESKWISITLSNTEAECEVSKFYKNEDDEIVITEGVHCSSVAY